MKSITEEIMKGATNFRNNDIMALVGDVEPASPCVVPASDGMLFIISWKNW